MRSTGTLALTLVAAAVLTGCPKDAVETARSPSAPSAPTNVQADAAVCVPPKCSVIRIDVTVNWDAAKTGDAVTGYDIYTGVLKAGSVGPDATIYLDRGVEMGASASYQVVARSALGNSPRSETATLDAPFPPASAAQLTGTYRATVTVESVQYLDVLEGIEGVKPGDTRTFPWGFTATCPANTGPCPTKVFSFTPPIAPKGRTYAGTANSPDATCGSTKVPLTYTYDLVTDGGVVTDGLWRVKHFEGSYVISFVCRGVHSTSKLGVSATAVE